MAVKTFTSGEVLTASDTNTYLNNAGYVYITELTFTGSTQTFLRIQNCFTSTYDNYLIVCSEMKMNTNLATVQLYLDHAGRNDHYYGGNDINIATATSGVVAGAGVVGQFIGWTSQNQMDSVIAITAVSRAKRKGFHVQYSHDSYAGVNNGQDRSSTARTGFDIVVWAGGTQFNDGRVRVYGMRQP